MKIGAAILLFLSLVALPAAAADDESLARMAMCRDSWFDWQKSDPAKLKEFGDHLRSGFLPHGNDAYVVPKSSVSIAGLRVVELFPESEGMGVGFSVTVEASFEETRAAIEKAAHAKFAKCETGDGMKTCAAEIGEKRTLTLMAEDDPKATNTLVGCYYFYEK